MALSFTEIIKEADENTRMVSNVNTLFFSINMKSLLNLPFCSLNSKEVIIKSVMEEKSTALIC